MIVLIFIFHCIKKGPAWVSGLLRPYRKLFISLLTIKHLPLTLQWLCETAHDNHCYCDVAQSMLMLVLRWLHGLTLTFRAGQQWICSLLMRGPGPTLLAETTVFVSLSTFLDMKLFYCKTYKIFTVFYVCILKTI